MRIVTNGAPAATIVVPAAPGPAWFAAGELREHVRAITGAELPVVKDGAPVEGTRIEIGDTAAARAAGLGSALFKEQEYAIAFRGNVLFLAGADPALNAAQTNSPLDFTKRPGWYTPMGSLYAVYDLLERYCGVRWYFPTDDGCVLPPKTNTLALAAKDLRRRPALELRQNPGSGQPSTWGTVGREPTSDERDLHMLRMKMGGKNWLIGHSFEGYPDRFWEKNPSNPDVWEWEHKEYFALKANGMRDVQQMCFSSTALVAQVVKEARDYFDGKGLKYRATAGPGYFTIGPRDVGSDVCQCPDCQAKISRSDWPFFTSGKCSDLVWGFVNEVSREVRKTHPEAKIACFGYFDYAFYPTNVPLEPEAIYGGSCLHTANWWAPAMKKNDLACYKGWVDKLPRGGQVCVWMYQCFPWENGQQQGFKAFPSWHAHTIDRQIKMFAADGVRGVFVCGQVTFYIDGYLTMKLMDDPTLDVDAVLDEFFARFYGAAAKPMKQLYLAIEKTYMGTENYPEAVREGRVAPHQNEEMAWKLLGTTERMAQFAALLDQAKAASDTDASKRHVAAYEKDVWRHMLDGKQRWDTKVKYADEVAKLRESPPPALGSIPLVAELGAQGDPAKVDWSKALVARVERGTDGYPAPGRDVTLRLLHDGEVKNHAFGQEESWDGHARRVDSKDGGYWTINMSVPIANMSKNPIATGDTFYINFIRATSKGVQPLALNPLFQTGFHCLPRLAEATLEGKQP